MAELTDEEVIDAMQGASQRMTYVVANILRMTHKHHNGTLGTAKVLRRLKALEKRGVVERVRSDYAVQICWRLTHNAALTERDDGARDEAADAIEYLLAENERLKHNLTSTEQTMREYQELAAKRLEEIERLKDLCTTMDGQLGKRPCQNNRCLEYNRLAAELAKYRDAPVVGYATTNEEGDLAMLFFDEQEARKYSGAAGVRLEQRVSRIPTNMAQLEYLNMRELNEHKINPGNDTLTITVLDEPGHGGANHAYDIEGGEAVPTHLRFQNGPINADGNGVNGITHEALLAVLCDRLRGFQHGPYACKANACALTHLEEAQHWLQQRTIERMRRGVEGTHTV